AKSKDYPSRDGSLHSFSLLKLCSDGVGSGYRPNALRKRVTMIGLLTLGKTFIKCRVDASLILLMGVNMYRTSG
ncbi:MAG: hypothetical protein ACLFV7_06645, partial [Phycisphaerae bacterium]